VRSGEKAKDSPPVRKEKKKAGKSAKSRKKLSEARKSLRGEWRPKGQKDFNLKKSDLIERYLNGGGPKDLDTKWKNAR